MDVRNIVGNDGIPQPEPQGNLAQRVTKGIGNFVLNAGRRVGGVAKEITERVVLPTMLVVGSVGMPYVIFELLALACGIRTVSMATSAIINIATWMVSVVVPVVVSVTAAEAVTKAITAAVRRVWTTTPVIVGVMQTIVVSLTAIAVLVGVRINLGPI